MADWNRLGKRVNAERIRLGFSSTRKFAPFVNVTSRTLDSVEAGKGPFSDGTLAKLEIAFNWEPGSCELIMEHKRPRIIVDPPLRRLHDLWALMSPEQRVSLVAGVESMLGQAHSSAVDRAAGDRRLPGGLA